MEQNFNINDIEIVLSKVLDDMELKQVIKLFKNYKKDEKIIKKSEIIKNDLSFEDIRLTGSIEFMKFGQFDMGRMTNIHCFLYCYGSNPNDIYYLKQINGPKSEITFIFTNERAEFDKPIKVISFEEFQNWIIYNYPNIERVKQYIQSLNTNKYEEDIPF